MVINNYPADTTAKLLTNPKKAVFVKYFYKVCGKNYFCNTFKSFVYKKVCELLFCYE